MNNRLTRRRFLQLAAGTTAASWLVACQAAPRAESGEAGAAPSREVIELVYYDIDESGAGEEGIAVYASVAEQYTEAHPNVRIKFDPALAGWSDKLITSLAAGEAPDIFFHFIDLGRQVMEAGQMLALNDYFTPEELDDFLEQQLIAMRIEDTLFAMPKYISTNAMAYNKTLLDQAGVPVPDPNNWTWTEFFDLVEKSAIALQGDTDSELGSLFGFFVNEAFNEHWVWQNGGEVMNGDILGTKCLLDSPESIQALQMQYDLRWKQHYAPQPAEVEGLVWPNAFQTGRFAFHEPHSWMVSDLIRSNDFEWDFIALPQGPVRNASLVFNDAWSVWAGTKHPTEAVEFLRFLTSAENEKAMMLSVHGWLPSRKSLFEAWNTESLGAQNGYNVSAFTKGLEVARQDPYFKENAKVAEIWGPIWDQIWETGELDLEEGLVLLTGQVNEYLATVA